MPSSFQEKLDKIHNNNRILLIALYDYRPSSIRGMHALLKKHGFDAYMVFIKEQHEGNVIYPITDGEYKKLCDLIKEINPMVIGISVSSSALYKTCSDLTKRLREDTDSLLLWGGVHPTVEPEMSIEKADIVCIGEGEPQILQLCEKLNRKEDITSIKGLWFRNNGNIIKNELMPLPENLDDIPIPTFTNEDTFFLNNGTIKRFDPIYIPNWYYASICSRGCPFRCSFCTNDYLIDLYKGLGKYRRNRSVDHIISELSFVKKNLKSVKLITLLDSLFVFEKDWLKEFTDKYKKEIGMPWYVMSHTNVLNEELIKIMWEGGLRYISFGIQSGSERVRSEVFNRREKNDKIIEVMDILHKYKITTVLDFIMNNPYEVKEDSEKELDLLLRIRPFDLHMFSMIFLPKTKLTDRLLNENIITNEMIEGNANKGMTQWLVTYKNPPTKEYLFWICLNSLAGKTFIPKALIKNLRNNQWLKSHPKPLIYLSTSANFILSGFRGMKLIIQGQVTFALIRMYIRHFFKVVR
jgi:anaerobic magnesium-protoporphyrin IX monomethyl ester cyclase